MSGWGKFLLSANLLLLTGLVAIFGYDTWLARSEREQVSRSTVTDMIAAVETRLQRYAEDAAARQGPAQPALSDEDLRAAVKSGVEEALAAQTSATLGARAVEAASSFSIELGARTQELLENLSARADKLADPASVTRDGEVSPVAFVEDAALRAKWLEQLPPTAAGPRPASGGDMKAPLAKGESRRLVEVHFSHASDNLTPGGKRKTHQAAEALKALDPRKIRVIGFTDTTGSTKRNLVLSRKRADAVASMLASLGVPPDRIEVVGRGENGPPEYTGDNVDEPLNRCVGIIAVN